MFDRGALLAVAGLTASAMMVLNNAPGAAATTQTSPSAPPQPNGTVQVMNANTGAPVLGAHVRFFRQDDGRTIAQLITDRDGVASARLDSGDYRYIITKPGFQQVRGAISFDSHDGAAVWNINVILTPGFTPITQDVSLCSDMIDQYQPGTVYVVCNGP